MIRTTIVLSIFAAACQSLTCYENDNEGNVYEITNASWTYCSLLPFAKVADGQTLMGIGPEIEDTEGYDAMFGHKSSMFRILTLCVLERYDFSMASRLLPQKPEFMFRCFCNYDRCNKATTFAAYLGAIKADNS